MGLSISRIDLAKIRREDAGPELEGLITGRKDSFNRRFKTVEEASSGDDILKGYNKSFGFHYGIAYWLEDDGQESLQFYKKTSFIGEKKLCKRFVLKHEDEEVVPMYSEGMQLVSKRIDILSGLAIAEIIPGSSYFLYENTRKIENRLIRIHERDIFRILAGKIGSFTTTEEMFESAFKTLWFHFPIDITGYDERIKRICLEEKVFE